MIDFHRPAERRNPQTTGSAAQQAALKPLLVGSLDLLSRFIDPPDADSGFLDMWASDPAAVASVREQLANLQVRLAELA